MDSYELIEQIADYFQGLRSMPKIPSFQAHIAGMLIQQGRELAETRQRLAVQDMVRAAEYRQQWLTTWGQRAAAVSAGMTEHERAVIAEAIGIMQRLK